MIFPKMMRPGVLLSVPDQLAADDNFLLIGLSPSALDPEFYMHLTQQAPCWPKSQTTGSLIDHLPVFMGQLHGHVSVPAGAS